MKKNESGIRRRIIKSAIDVITCHNKDGSIPCDECTKDLRILVNLYMKFLGNKKIDEKK